MIDERRVLERKERRAPRCHADKLMLSCSNHHCRYRHAVACKTEGVLEAKAQDYRSRKKGFVSGRLHLQQELVRLHEKAHLDSRSPKPPPEVSINIPRKLAEGSRAGRTTLHRMLRHARGAMVVDRRLQRVPREHG